jgi:hypothetical protein
MSIFQPSSVTRTAAITFVLTTITTGCQYIPFLAPISGNVDLQFSVKPIESGVYQVSGDTNLPDKTRLAIVAVRYLEPAATKPQRLSHQSIYSVLAYQTAQVQAGKWQTQLSLWQVAPDGTHKEAWQIDQKKLKLAIKPDENVVFLATLNPVSEVDQLSGLEQQLREKKLNLGGKLIYTTPEGQQYVQVLQAQAVPLPEGKTSKPQPRTEEINGGWGRRYLMPGEPQNPYLLEQPAERQTNAPSRREEFLR